MKPVRAPFAALCASWGFLLGKAYEQSEFGSSSLVELPSFRHPQLTLFSVPQSAVTTAGCAHGLHRRRQDSWRNG